MILYCITHLDLPICKVHFYMERANIINLIVTVMTDEKKKKKKKVHFDILLF